MVLIKDDIELAGLETVTASMSRKRATEIIQMKIEIGRFLRRQPNYSSQTETQGFCAVNIESLKPKLLLKKVHL